MFVITTIAGKEMPRFQILQTEAGIDNPHKLIKGISVPTLYHRQIIKEGLKSPRLQYLKIMQTLQALRERETDRHRLKLNRVEVEPAQLLHQTGKVQEGLKNLKLRHRQGKSIRLLNKVTGKDRHHLRNPEGDQNRLLHPKAGLESLREVQGSRNKCKEVNLRDQHHPVPAGQVDKVANQEVDKK